jgi:hypothetical protein
MYYPKEPGRRGMTVSDLIGILERVAEEEGEDTLIRLMTQQSYPFENGITGVTTSAEFGDDDEDPDCYPPDDVAHKDDRRVHRRGRSNWVRIT